MASQSTRCVALAKAILGCDDDDAAQACGKLDAYFKRMPKIGQFFKTDEETIFFINIIRSNMSLEREALSRAVETLKEDRGRENAERTVLDRFHRPDMKDEVKKRLKEQGFNIENALIGAVRSLFALDLATTDTAGGGPGLKFWDSSTSLADVITRSFPRSQQSETPLPFDKKKVAARYLKDHAGVKIQWTINLAEHLYLEEKTLYVFELVGLLEVAYIEGRRAPSTAGGQDCVRAALLQ